MSEYSELRMQDSEFEGVENGEASVLPSSQVEVRPPAHYRVLLHNDDYTPMDFVIEVLRAVFHKEATAATKIMLDVHQKGVGICGVFPFEIAETKVGLVSETARKNQFPLKCTMEEE